MENKEPVAQFTVCVTSVENAAWQGTVQTEHAVYSFKSEMELLSWLLEQYPALLPEHPEWKD